MSSPTATSHATRNTQYAILALLTLLAFILRVRRLDSVPPGLRVDELSNTFVVSQHVLDGQYRFFFPDASGHEGLWHALQAAFIAIFGHTAFGARGVSAVLGTLTVPLTFLVGRELFNRRVGLLAAAGVTVSFWSLMYSRVATRHISTLPFLLLGFWLFLTAMKNPSPQPSPAGRGGKSVAGKWFVFAGIALGLTLHTYFAGWVVVAVVGAFFGYLVLFERAILRGKWVGYGVMFGLVALLGVLVVNDMRAMPAVEEEGRINVVAAPLHAAREGDFSLVFEHVVQTFGMFVNTGDSEWLYNVPFRPIFHPIVAFIFWIGVAILLWQIVRGFGRGKSEKRKVESRAGVFLLFWWVAGLSPAFISVPPASLGHTLAAQPAVYIMLALPLAKLWQYAASRWQSTIDNLPLTILLPILTLTVIGLRDLPSYFTDWSQRGNVRFLYHADHHDVGDWLYANPDVKDFAITGLLIEQWEQVALDLYAPDDVRPRWYDPQRAVMLELGGEPALSFAGYPVVDEAFDGVFSAETQQVSGYQLRTLSNSNINQLQMLQPAEQCFNNGLCIDAISYQAPILDITWRVAEQLDVPARQLTSFPPIPGDYAGPRLYAFAHLWNSDAQWLTGDDGWWVDPAGLQVGDRFRQRHILIAPDGTATIIAIGLYDPLTGERIIAASGEDHYAFPLPP